MGKQGELDTIWEVPDKLWEEIEQVIREIDPPKETGRPRVDARRAFDGIIYRLRTSCQWNHLPENFGSDSSVHRTFQRWVEKGVFQEVWALLIERCDDLGAVEWKWQAADGAMGKARSGGTSSARTRRTERKLEARRASSSTVTAGR
jgi:putative transposase